ncbi:Serotype-specific antigen 1 precursor [Mannheimia haemolytica]|nr:Serotype-specific antigen 1 precursor [Mannheimia haemolytica]
MYKIKHSFNKTLIAISISSFLSIAYATESIGESTTYHSII